MSRKYAPKRHTAPDPFPASGHNYEYVCPCCGQPMALYDLRDGDQAYWCHRCGTGHRAGQPLLEALRPEQAGGTR